MVIKVNIDNQFSIKETSKIYAREYAYKALKQLEKGVDKIDAVITR